MKLLSDSLNEIAGEKMKTLLEKIAGNRIKGVLVGALVTAVIQSSSATTVMVIGFVNANMMDINQAASIIIGANIGTTATGLLASLESLNISLYLSLLTFIGVMLTFIKRIKKIANLLTGLGMIFVGLKLMSDSCNDESIKNSFENVLKKISFPLLLELLGVIFTAIIQSSSAMTGIVIVMVGNKVMDMNNGLFITLGANVGTCVTALIGIIGGNINSKRTAVIHLTFNIFGCILFTPILWILNKPILNILKAIVVIIAKKVVKDEKKDEEIIQSLIKDINEIGINPKETINILNEEIKDKGKEGKKYKPPSNLTKEKNNKDNDINDNKIENKIKEEKNIEKIEEKTIEEYKIKKDEEDKEEIKEDKINDNKKEEQNENENLEKNKEVEKNGEEKKRNEGEDDKIEIDSDK